MLSQTPLSIDHLPGSVPESEMQSLAVIAPPEEKIAIHEVNALPIPELVDHAPLQYLKGMSEAELNQLVRLYERPPHELERLITQNKNIYQFFYVHYWIANYGSCLLFLYYPIVTSSQGIETVVQEFNPNAVVPSYINYSVNWPLSILDIIYFMAVFSVTNEATRSTLHYLDLPPLRDNIAYALQIARDEPRMALLGASRFLAHQVIILPCNATGAIAELIFLPLDFSEWYVKVLIVFTVFYGNEYFRKYTNIDYYQGIDFFLNLDRPWVFRERNFATWLQVTLQGLSAIGITVFPVYYFLAIAAESTVGFWFPPIMIMVLKAIHASMIFYPSTYDFYMKDYEEILLRLSEEPAMEETLRQMAVSRNLEFTASIERKMLRMVFDVRKKIFLQELKEQYSWLLLFLIKNDMASSLLALMGAMLGLYCGYGFALQLVVDLPLAAGEVLLMPAGFLLIGKAFYDAELERAALQKMNHHEPPPSSKTDKIANFLNVSGGSIAAMSTVGTLQPVVGKNSPITTTVITLLSVQRMLNSISFNRDKIKVTVSAFAKTLPSVREYCGSFFNRSAPNDVSVAHEPRASWKCWGRRQAG